LVQDGEEFILLIELRLILKNLVLKIFVFLKPQKVRFSSIFKQKKKKKKNLKNKKKKKKKKKISKMKKKKRQKTKGIIVITITH